MILKRHIISLFAAAVLAAGCGRGNGGNDSGSAAPDGYGVAEHFTVEVMNRYTPVKDQGRSPLCWAYAMLAAIETEHIMRGDSVHLSAAYAARALAIDNYRRACLTRGHGPYSMRGTAQTLLNVISRHGLVAHDAYRDRPNADYGVLSAKLRRLARMTTETRAGLHHYDRQVDEVADAMLGAPPRQVFMFGAKYTPGEFARSVCAPDEYMGITSFTHHPFGERFVLEVPDNWEQTAVMNVPIDTLMARMEHAVRTGRGVCWEGDTSEPAFSFARGTARLEPSAEVSQEARQRAFERYQTTDDHCMAVVGLARDGGGRLFFIMKNSWGTDNPYGGLMYLSADYVRMKTIAVFMPKECSV